MLKKLGFEKQAKASYSHISTDKKKGTYRYRDGESGRLVDVKKKQHKKYQKSIGKPGSLITKTAKAYSKEPGYWNDVKEVNKGIRWLPAVGLAAGMLGGAALANKIINRGAASIPSAIGGGAAMAGTTVGGLVATAIPQTHIRAKRIKRLPESSPLRQQYLYTRANQARQTEKLLEANKVYTEEWKQVPRSTGSRQKRHDETMKRIRSRYDTEYDDVLAQVGLT